MRTGEIPETFFGCAKLTVAWSDFQFSPCWTDWRAKISSHAGEGVDFGDRFVWTQADDAGESQGVAGVVALGALDVVEGNLDDDVWLDGAAVAGDLRACEPGNIRSSRLISTSVRPE